jgi:PAS domain S-box-containing protein
MDWRETATCMLTAETSGPRRSAQWAGLATYAAALVAVAAVYFVLAKFGLTLASVNPSATPIWPATGFAIAAVLLLGYRLLPAILVGAFLANATTAGSAATSAAIAIGNSLEALVAAWLINKWSNGRNTFESPIGVAKFALISFAPSTMLSATVGVVSLSLAGYAEWTKFSAIWVTWWLGDLTGALVLTPFIVLWANGDGGALRRAGVRESLTIFGFAAAIGVVAFSPLLQQTVYLDPLGFLAVIPLLWAALRGSQRDTATVALILSSVALWSTYLGTGPFARVDVNESYLLLLMFTISVTVPSLVLSADVAQRHASEQELQRARQERDRQVEHRIAELADKERQFRLLVQGVSDYAIFMVDTEGYVTSWNSGAEKIKGYSASEVIGTHFSRFYTEEDRATGLPAIALATAAREGRSEQEGQRVRKDGTVYWASTAVYRVRDDRGQVIGFAKITRDIDEWRKAQAAVDSAREQLSVAQKMDALGQLTGGVAHDFNNLLTIINSRAEMLRRQLSAPEQLEILDIITSTVWRGANLTRQLLTFSRRQQLDAEVIDLREHIASIRPMLRTSLPENIELIEDIAPDLWLIEVDPGELDLAILNVAVNARDSMPGGGRFRLAARNVTLSRYSPAGSLQGEFVELSLSDSGAGIPPDVLPRIFEPFFTTKPVGRGTGLGLSQVYGFSHQSGGTVSVSSKPGGGTTITMLLPRTRAQRPDNSDWQQPVPAEVAEPKTILVVEDDPMVAQATASLLQLIGYRTLHADNAADALELLGKGGIIDLVFSDVVMPGGMNGVELAREIKLRHPDTPVVLNSGYSEQVQRAGLQFEVLRKPFDLTALEQTIGRALVSSQRSRGAGNSARRRPA